MKDWTSGANSVFKNIASSRNADSIREENDFYATHPIATELFIKAHPLSDTLWEPACGQGHISKVLVDAGKNVRSTDLIDRGYGLGGVDFLSDEHTCWQGDIITNPPYKLATKFIEKGLSIIHDGRQLAMFLKLQFLESKGRKKLFLNHPPKVVYVSSSRIQCAKGGDFEILKDKGRSAVANAWYVWEKGFKGDTIIKWFN